MRVLCRQRKTQGKLVVLSIGTGPVYSSLEVLAPCHCIISGRQNSIEGRLGAIEGRERRIAGSPGGLEFSFSSPEPCFQRADLLTLLEGFAQGFHLADPGLDVGLCL